MFMPLTCPLASCPETGHPLFFSAHVANSWVASALAAATAQRICNKGRRCAYQHSRGPHKRGCCPRGTAPNDPGGNRCRNDPREYKEDPARGTGEEGLSVALPDLDVDQRLLRLDDLRSLSVK